jgi:2-dehydropantoate 2-reductase
VEEFLRPIDRSAAQTCWKDAVNILVYGAGVIGTLYAARLRESGHRVTVLARGGRLRDIRNYGLVLQDIVSGRRSTTQVDTTESLNPDDQYDAVFVAVRRDQLNSALQDLVANRGIPTILFMLNNPNGSRHLVKILGEGRVLLGFPGAGGTRDGHIVHYALIAQQPTTMGEIGGRRTARLCELSAAFREAGFSTKISRNMDAWLKTHAFFVTAVCGAIYLSGGDCRRLSEDDAALTLMTKGVCEGFAAVRALELPVSPFPLKVLFAWLPLRFAIRYWRRFFATKVADVVFGQHARIAAREMRDLASDCRMLLEQSGVEASALAKLYGAVDAYAARIGPNQIPERRSEEMLRTP